MMEILVKAIEETRLIRFGYKGESRLVEPHAYGLQFNGARALCGWQVEGGSGISFRLYLADEMSGLEMLDEAFDGPRDGYRRGDKRFSVIYAEL